VAHFCRPYYRLSENWIVTQVLHTRRYRPLVLAEHLDTIAGAPSFAYIFYEQSPLALIYNRIIRKFTGFSPGYYRRIRRSRAAVIHAHMGQLGWESLPLVRATGLPLLTTFYGNDASGIPEQYPEWRTRYRELFQAGTLFLAEGPALAERIERLGCPAEKIRVQRLGIELNHYPLRDSWSTPESPLRVLLAGRMVEKKGMPFGLRALSAAIRQGANIRATVIGDAADDDRSRQEKAEIEAVIKDGDLSDRVSLLGMQPLDVLRKAYYAHDVFLAPSVIAADGNSEGGAPVTLIEAAATGMAIVSTRHADIPYVVEHDQTALLADERNETQLCEYLLRLDRDRVRLRTLGEAAAARMRDRYDANKQGEALDGLYDEARAR
ncbi:MAG: glycosyltransferase, partial [Verrucomicrobia bacterium]|nr:glycosyltransferase [Verrucomicrobiota bacterium]